MLTIIVHSMIPLFTPCTPQIARPTPSFGEMMDHITIKFIEGNAMDKSLHEEVYAIIKENMEDMCNQSNFPWNDALERRNRVWY